MKKKLLVTLTGIIVIAFIGLVFAGNYFYGEGIKRGTEVELHQEVSAVNPVASAEDQALLETANNWFDVQELEEIEMTSFDDLNLVAQHIGNDTDAQKAVILAHGFRNTGEDMGKLTQFYFDRGFDILLPDARGHGKSDGNYIGYGW